MSVSCPTCGSQVPETSDFCSNCGRPRTATKQRIEEQARREDVSYFELLERERARAGISIPISVTLQRLENQFDQVDRMMRDLSARLERVETRVFGVRPAPARPQPVEREMVSPQPVQSVFIADVPVPDASVAPAEEAFSEPTPGSESTWGHWQDALPQNRSDLEDLLSGRILAWIGGLAVVIGAIFFLSMAFSRGWIGPELRVLIGVISSLGILTAGAWFSERLERVFAFVLIAVGLGVMNISLLAATRLYDFVPVEAGLFAVLATSSLAAFVAVRSNAQIVAVFGLIAALVAPLMFGGEATLTTAAFVSVVLLATTGIALYRGWRWLPPIAFLLSAIQVPAFVTREDINTFLALGTLSLFWLIYAVSAGGEEFRRSRGRLSVTSATVLILAALFTLGLSFEVLDGSNEVWRGFYLVLLAMANGVLGGYFMKSRGEKHPFGVLALGTGVAVFTMSIPVQFGGATVPIAWAAEATALAWIFASRRHGYAGVYSAALGFLAILHLMAFEYPLEHLTRDLDSTWPFINSNGLTLAFVVGALAVSAFLVRDRRLAAVPIIGAFSLVAYAVPFELSGALHVLGWSVLVLGLMTLDRRLTPEAPVFQGAASILFGMSFLYTMAAIVPMNRLAVHLDPIVDHPLFWSEATAALGMLIAVSSVAVWLYRDHIAARNVLVPITAALAVYLLSVGVVDEFQSRVGGDVSLATLQKQAQVALSILWAVLGGAAFTAGIIRFGAPVRLFGLAVLALATAKVFLVDLAALDTSYRVLSFIGLGILLLASSFAYQHFKPALMTDDDRRTVDEPV